MGFGTRQPTSNESAVSKERSPWLETTDLLDETALILSGMAGRCSGPCRRLTSKKHLNENRHCPDCSKADLEKG